MNVCVCVCYVRENRNPKSYQGVNEDSLHRLPYHSIESSQENFKGVMLDIAIETQYDPNI